MDFREFLTKALQFARENALNFEGDMEITSAQDRYYNRYYTCSLDNARFLLNFFATTNITYFYVFGLLGPTYAIFEPNPPLRDYSNYLTKFTNDIAAAKYMCRLLIELFRKDCAGIGIQCLYNFQCTPEVVFICSDTEQPNTIRDAVNISISPQAANTIRKENDYCSALSGCYLNEENISAFIATISPATSPQPSMSMI